MHQIYDRTHDPIQRMESGPPPKPSGEALGTPQTPVPKNRVKRKKKKRLPPRTSKTVWGAAPNGIDHAILLVGLGIFVSLVLFAIFRVIVASQQ